MKLKLLLLTSLFTQHLLFSQLCREVPVNTFDIVLAETPAFNWQRFGTLPTSNIIGNTLNIPIVRSSRFVISKPYHRICNPFTLIYLP